MNAYVTGSSATRAYLFMRQCRVHTISRRGVSSSHLAPSNFSKPLRLHDAPSQVPSRKAPTREQIEPQANPNHRLPDPYSNEFRQQQKHFQSEALTSPTQSSKATTIIPIPSGFWNFVKYRLLNLPPPRPAVKPPPFNTFNNPYRARKSWPPNFTTLHPKQQFHFEKTWRRRLILKNKSQRYNFNRYVKLLQQSLIVLSLIYFVFIADPYVKEGGGTPLDGFRAWFFGQFAKNEHIPDALKEQATDLQAYYSRNWSRKDEEREEVVAKALESNMASSQAVLEARGKKNI